MKNQPLKLYLLTCLLLAGFALFAHQSSAQKPKQNWRPEIPKTWVDAEMEELEVPLADPIASPKQISAFDAKRLRDDYVPTGLKATASGRAR